MRTNFQFPARTLLACVLLSALAAGGTAQGGREAEHNRKGLEYFKDAFYQRIPKGQQREADQAFDVAAAEFRKAVALKPDFVDAHRNLARLYYVRRQFAEAAEAYRTVTRLVPGDLDAYVQAALAYIELGRSDEAIRQLEFAKSRTDDREAIRKLEGYAQKIRERR